MTSVLPPKARTWNPARDGGDCSGTTYEFIPEMYDDDAYVPVPSVIAQLCSRCPFRDDCLKWALDNDEVGFWAGTSRFQRLQLGRTRSRVKCPGCGSTGVMVLDMSEVCTSCGMSWLV